MKFSGIWIILLFVLIGIPLSIAENSLNQTDTTLPESPSVTSDDLMESLARIDVQDTISGIPLPIYAHLLSSNGSEYVLVKATPVSLQESGLPHTILDPDTRNATYAIASWKKTRGGDISDVATILYDDGDHLILKTERAATRSLLNAGYQVNWLGTIPRTFRETQVSALQEPPAGYDSRIADMVDRVHQDALTSPVASLSGAKPVTVGGQNYTILSRDALYPELLNTSTEYVYEYLSDRIPNVSYFPYVLYGFDGRNVIGEKTGIEKPEEIILVTAHIDSYSTDGYAPGADDDGTGTAAVMACADIFRQYAFERTIRFVIFTREEDGLYGSNAYALNTTEKNETIVAVFNMDMIGWNGDTLPTAVIHTRLPGDASGYADDMVIAEQFNRSVHIYNLSQDLTPRIISDGVSASDHFSFWSVGYPAVLAIEDDDDFNPYYHSSRDRLEYLNSAYFTNFTQASLATVASFSGPMGSPLTISSISPKSATNYGPDPVINLTGTGLLQNTTVTLTRSGSKPLIAGGKSFVAPDTLSCQIPISGADPGTWNIRVQNPDGKIDLIENGFTITSRPDSTISSSCSVGGTISPSGQIQVPYGGNKTYSLNPFPGYLIESVQINNVSVGPVTDYTFTNVTTNQTIFGNFTLIPPPSGSFLIVASHDQGGIIEPDGVVIVPQNESRVFTMTGLNGYEISSVLVDGIDVGKNSSYTFSSVQENHTISLNTRQKPGVVLLTPTLPTLPGLGYTYYNPYGSDRSYLIYAPGTYILSEGFSTRNQSAIRIISDDVSLDGNGKSLINVFNSIEGIYSIRVSNITIQNFGMIQDFFIGVAVQNGESALVHNNTILSTRESDIGITVYTGKNCSVTGNVIQGNFNGINVNKGLNNTVTSNRITNATNGILVYSNGTIAEDNWIQDCSGTGIETTDNVFGPVMYGNRLQRNALSIGIMNKGGSGHGTIYNNYLAGLENVGGDGNGSRYGWTNPGGPTPGTSVMGGPYIAGNYWSNSYGSGWSDRKPGNTNGYTLTPYEVFPGSNDTAPLVPLVTPTQQQYYLNSSSDSWTINYPGGNASYPEGSTKTYFTQAKPGADLLEVIVDEQSNGPNLSWTFANISSDHSITTLGNASPGQVHAFFSGSPIEGKSPLFVQFTDESLGSPYKWHWQFGDGKTDTIKNPNHTYEIPGIYSVSLRAMNNQTGGQSTWNNYITVT